MAIMSYLSLVHEEEQISDDFFVCIFEDYDGVFFWQISEEMIEVVAAGCQDHPVSADSLAIGAGQADVDQGVGVQQLLEAAERVQAVVVPLQVELLGLHISLLAQSICKVSLI